MKARTLIIVTLLATTLMGLISQGFADSDPTSGIIPKAQTQDGETSSKEDKGILATMILVYVKVRNAVKYAYDEIQYWKGQKQTYDMMADWFDRSTSKIGNISSTAADLVQGKGDVFAKLDKAVNLCDQIDDVAFNESRNFDRLLAHSENLYDASVNNGYMNGEGDTIRLLRFVPNTGEAINYLTQLTSGDSVQMTPQQAAYLTLDQQAKLQEEFDSTNARIGRSANRNIEEKKIADIGRLVVASTMANSNSYVMWAQAEMDNVNTLDSKFAGLTAVTEKEGYDAWVALEQVNANNKRLRHSMEELKMYAVLLGTDSWEATASRAHQENLKRCSEAIRMEQIYKAVGN